MTIFFITWNTIYKIKYIRIWYAFEPYLDMVNCKFYQSFVNILYEYILKSYRVVLVSNINKNYLSISIIYYLLEFHYEAVDATDYNQIMTLYK